MSTTPRPAAALLFLLAPLVWAGPALGVRDEDNQGRWQKPTANAPDQAVPGFLVNLGPTGGRAILKANSFVVKHVFAKSPAAGKLRIDDEIVAVNGKTFSTHTFGGRSVGYDGPMMDFGRAIEDSEGKDGKLALRVKRDGRLQDVTVQLEPIGRFAPTFPLHCKKSELLKQRAYRYLMDHPESFGGMPHARAAVCLALLTSGNPQYESAAKRAILAWNQVPGPGTWTWNLSYQMITLAEYHLQTGDASVLPTLRAVSQLLRKAQYQGVIEVWGAHGGGDQATIDKHQALYEGGFGHAPYRRGVGRNGYGPMQFPTILAVIAWQLAEKCGVTIDDQKQAVEAAFRFIDRGTADDGHVAYGGEFTLNNGPVDPVRWKKGRSDAYVGRVGAALMAYNLSPEISDSAATIKQLAGYIDHAHKSLPDGHACPILGFTWGLLGSAASHDEALMRTMFDYHKAWFNMARCHDGSFVVLPGRDYADGSYYGSPRYHLTGVMALFFGLNNPKLQIQGVAVAIPGVNHKALRGDHAAAYKLIVKKHYGAAAKKLAPLGGSDNAVAAAMMTIIDAEAKKALARLASHDGQHRWDLLQTAIQRSSAVFAGVPPFDRAADRWADVFEQKPGGLIVEADRHYGRGAYAQAAERLEEAAASGASSRWAERIAPRRRRIDQAAQQALGRLETLYREGSWHDLKQALDENRANFEGIAAYDRKADTWQEALTTPTGRAMVDAHRLYLEQSYGLSVKALSAAETGAAAKALRDRNHAATAKRIEDFEQLEASGRWHALQDTLNRSRFKMTGLESFDAMYARCEAAFKTDFGRQMVLADRLIDKHSFQSAVRALKAAAESGESPDRAAMIQQQFQRMDAAARDSMQALVLLEQQGDWYLLKKMLARLERKLKGIPSFDAQARRWEAKFETDAVAGAVKSGGKYHQLLSLLRRNPSHAGYLKLLRSFAQKEGDSFYGRQAAELLKQQDK